MGGDMSGEEMPMDDMGGEEMGDEEVDVDVDVDTEEDGNEDQVTFKTIQKLTGKLTQKIRTLDNEEGMTSEDVKYVINMVLSALDLTSLSEEDKEDIMAKFEEDETEDYGQEDDMDGEDMTDDTEVEDIQADMDVPVEGYELGEDYEDSRYSEDYDEDYDVNNTKGYSDHGAIFDSIFGESQVDKVISKYFEVSKKEIREHKEKQVQKTLQKKSVVKNIMESVTKMTETIEQELAAEKFVNENINSKFIGVTNKKNLVFETKSGQVKITPNGEIL
jgi:hypothetical protein